jgi:hypothetical protein
MHAELQIYTHRVAGAQTYTYTYVYTEYIYYDIYA